METFFQILIWSALFILVRSIGFTKNTRPLKPEEEIKVRKMLSWIRAIRLLGLVLITLFASPYHEWMVEKIGMMWCIISIAFIRWVCIDALDA